MKMRFCYTILYATLILLSILTGSCSNRQQHEYEKVGAVAVSLDYSKRIRLYDHSDGWVEVEIVNPWDTTKLLQRLALIPDSMSDIPLNIPSDAIILKTPLKRALVTTSAHINLIKELGARSSIAGVTDASYIKDEYILAGLSNNNIMDCGATDAPTIERVISLESDGILLSPYENNGDYGKLKQLSVPIIFTSDYMEPDPLGRAEWMKYYGMLFGRKNEADSLFKIVSDRYNELKQRINSTLNVGNRRPKVLLDLPYQGVWYVNGAESINDIFIRLAGGINPFSEKEKKGYVPYAPERVLLESGDADVWLIKYYSDKDLTMSNLKRDNVIAEQFEAFKKGKVYGVNTEKEMYFEEIPFHPEWLLGDMVEILHPDGHTALRYFHKLPE